MDGNSASCQEFTTTETRECRREINQWHQTEYYIDFVTRDCNGQNVSTRRGDRDSYECVDGTHTSFSCSGDNISPVVSTFDCNGNGCNRNGRHCCYPTINSPSSYCDGNTLINHTTFTDYSMCVPSRPPVDEEIRIPCPANTVCTEITEINNTFAVCR